MLGDGLLRLSSHRLSKAESADGSEVFKVIKALRPA
jgi:hypothetical protein